MTALSTTLSPQGSWQSAGRGRWKSSDMVDDNKETVSPSHNREDAQMNSQRWQKHAQDLHRFKEDKIPAQSAASNQQTISGDTRWEETYLPSPTHRYVTHTPAQAPCAEIAGQHKSNSRYFCLLFLWFICFGSFCLWGCFVYFDFGERKRTRS